MSKQNNSKLFMPVIVGAAATVTVVAIIATIISLLTLSKDTKEHYKNPVSTFKNSVSTNENTSTSTTTSSSDKQTTDTQSRTDLNKKAELNLAGSDGFDTDLSYDEITDQSGFTITGIGSCEDIDIVVPPAKEDYFGEVKPYLWSDLHGFTCMEKARSVTLPEGWLEIRSGFAGSPNLEWVAFPVSLRRMTGSPLFENCPSFKEIRYAGTMAQWQSIESWEYWNTDNGKPLSFDIVCSDGIIHSGKGTQTITSDVTSDQGNSSVSAPVKPAQDPTADQGYTALSDSAEIANALSTTDYAQAMDFEWFLDYILYGGEGAGQVIKDPSYTTQINKDMSVLLNGGWKAYIFPDSFTSDGEHYFNAEINTSDSSFNIIMNWKYFYDAYSGTSVEETGIDLFRGEWHVDGKTASAKSNYGQVTFDAFYINADATAEYAIGSFEWISGEKDRIALMRVHE